MLQCADKQAALHQPAIRLSFFFARGEGGGAKRQQFNLFYKKVYTNHVWMGRPILFALLPHFKLKYIHTFRTFVT